MKKNIKTSLTKYNIMPDQLMGFYNYGFYAYSAMQAFEQFFKTYSTQQNCGSDYKLFAIAQNKHNVIFKIMFNKKNQANINIPFYWKITPLSAKYISYPLNWYYYLKYVSNT